MENGMTREQFVRELESSLEIPVGTLMQARTLEDPSYWDSMSALTFMALADEKLDITLTGDQIVRCKTVDELLALLGDRLAG
jgi:acyl carrier protein